MSSYLNKLQEARKIAVEKYLVDNGINYTIVKHRCIDHYLIPDDEYLSGLKWTPDELVDWFGIKFEVDE